MNKSTIVGVLLAGLALNGCSSEVESKTEVEVEGLGFSEKLVVRSGTHESGYVYIYQHTTSGNCYSWARSWRGGEMSQVVCSDFGILATDEIKRNKLAIERKQYLKLKSKFDQIDCKSKPIEGKEGFYTVCPDVDEFGDSPNVW